MMTLPLPSQQNTVTPRLFEHNVLVIEPHPVLSELLFWMLVLAGYSATLTTKETLISPAWLGEQAHLAPPSLLLIDVDADGMSCLEDLIPIFSQLYAQWQVVDIPMLLLTSGSEAHMALQQAGFIALAKPFHLKVLQSLVQQMIAQESRNMKPSSPLTNTVHFLQGVLL
ncbi:MAG TPA: hypothetical protein VFB12_22025 [Ktedonobacteraceae bacterium]|nr:hypothetical protein [Ktedonobacteraceae bacterium]